MFLFIKKIHVFWIGFTCVIMRRENGSVFMEWAPGIRVTMGLQLAVNSLAPTRSQRNFRKVIFQLIQVIDGWSISCKIVLVWMPMDLTDGKSTLVQVMAWCHQATSYYLSQCWPRSLLPYGIIKPQWVKNAEDYGCINHMKLLTHYGLVMADFGQN